ncbi:unnamed protein product [Clavelina lepadiformis]|uniref:Small integral membrane protein 4 n=1 Tax=Clavelina lepadiformis TaxID=159417 RepID=A0ABP0FKA0_CLALP
MNFLRKSVSVFLQYYPFKKHTPYRLVPLFFVVGACMEYVMINFPGAGAGETFYDVWRRKQSERQYKLRANQELVVLGEKSTSVIESD